MDGTRSENGSPRAISGPFAALKHRNFRYFWLGMAVSATGSWMQNTAQPWLAYKLTSSPFLLSLVSALQFVPVLLFALFAGVVTDRFPKKRIIFLTQVSYFVVTLALAVLDATGRIKFWHLLVASAMMGVINTFDMPARQAFVIELVGKEDLTNGIALNSAQFNLARLLGPAIAGVIMEAWGTAPCFFINAFSFGAVILSLFFIHPLQTASRGQPSSGSVFASIGEGLKFIFSREVLYLPLLFLAVSATFAMNFNVLVPVFAVEALHQKEAGFGLLMSAAGAGALAGALTMAALSKGGPKKAYIFGFPFIVGALICLMGLTRTYLLTAASLALTSFFYMIFMASVNSTMQLNATDEFRGRVMSVYSLVMAGSTPIGNLFAGAVADRYSAGVSLIACGGVIIAVLLPLYLLLRKNGRIEPGGLKG